MLYRRTHNLVGITIFGGFLDFLSLKKEFGYLLDGVVVQKTNPQLPPCAGNVHIFALAGLKLGKENTG